MTNEEIEKILEKMKFQIATIGQAIDFDRHPVESLIISMDWGQKEINLAHDVFEKWDKKLEAGEDISSYEFEADFSESLGLNYQRVKPVILSFYRNGQWTNVCEAYVDSFDGKASIEYREIMNRPR